VPLVAEPSGGWGPTGVDTLRRLARAAALRTGEQTGSVKSRFFQQLAISLRRAAARAVLRRPEDEERGEPASLAAARLVLDCGAE
jgi:hypothetical protein